MEGTPEEPMYYHHALLELEARAHTRDLVASAAAPAVGGIFQRFFQRCDSPTGEVPCTGRATPTPAS